MNLYIHAHRKNLLIYKGDIKFRDVNTKHILTPICVLNLSNPLPGEAIHHPQSRYLTIPKSQLPVIRFYGLLDYFGWRACLEFIMGMELGNVEVLCIG